MLDDTLDHLDLKELKALEKKIQAAIKARKDARKIEALQVLKKHAAEMGFKLEDLTSSNVKNVKFKRRRPEPKFANPENATDTWSGRGRKPLWFIRALQNGKKADDLLIKSA